jgi:hypothetical protein
MVSLLHWAIESPFCGSQLHFTRTILTACGALGQTVDLVET